MKGDSHSLSALLPGVLSIAREASVRILEIYHSGFSVEQKDDRTPLTEADIAAHEAILAGLQKLTAEIPVLSEESGEIPYEERASWQRYWLVDPLDGTREFIKRNGEFTVNIALIEGGKAVLGVIVAPESGLAYYASQGGGAYKQPSPDAVAEKIRTRRYNAPDTVVANSRSHGSEALQRFLKQLGPHRSVPMGSSLKSCLVAEGAADIYPRFGLTSEWDTAAAQCIVEEAGGSLVDLQLKPLQYNSKPSLLNPHFIVIGDPTYDWTQQLVSIK